MLGHEGPKPTRIAPIGVVTFEIHHRLLGAFTLAYAPARRGRSFHEKAISARSMGNFVGIEKSAKPGC